MVLSVDLLKIINLILIFCVLNKYYTEKIELLESKRGQERKRNGYYNKTACQEKLCTWVLSSGYYLEN